MVETLEGTSYQISGDAVDGWGLQVMQANNRSLPWWHIATELVDNALANQQQGKPCVVNLEWNTRGNKWFVACDHGRGSTEPGAFLSPGRTGGNHGEYGNATFGTGLFAVECVLNGKMDVVTKGQDGIIRTITRTIAKGQAGECQEFGSTQQTLAETGLSRDGGTRIRFNLYSKNGPGRDGAEKVARELGRCYATAITSGVLRLRIVFNGKAIAVRSEKRPDVQRLYSQTITMNGHRLAVEWGVTTKPTGDTGCRIIYGVKWFDTDPTPCAQYDPRRFYAAIQIPLSAGRECMDLLKRSIDRDFAEPLYDRCFALFLPQLQESHRLTEATEKKSLNDGIAKLLSKPDKRKKEKDEGSGDEDIRQSNGRDPNSKGVKPQGTTIKRRGRKGNGDDAVPPPPVFTVRWAPMGEESPLAEYNDPNQILTYNEDVALLARWKNEGNQVALAQVAAASIADKLRDKDPRKRSSGQLLLSIAVEGRFEAIYKTLMERIGTLAK